MQRATPKTCNSKPQDVSRIMKFNVNTFTLLLIEISTFRSKWYHIGWCCWPRSVGILRCIILTSVGMTTWCLICECADHGLDMACIDCMLRCTSVRDREHYTCFDKLCSHAWTSHCSRLGVWTTSLTLVDFADRYDDRIAQQSKGQCYFTGGCGWS